MSVKIHIHQHLREMTGGLEMVEAEGKTVGDCLKTLIRQFPDTEKELFSRKGELANHIEIYLNSESAYPDELKRPVRDGDDIYLVIGITGG